MTIERIKQILAGKPWLGPMGLEPTEQAGQRIKALADWITLTIFPSAKPYHDSTYTLKHIAEPAAGYSTDGEFCAALIDAGYEVTPWRGSARVCCRVGESVEATDRILLANGIDPAEFNEALRRHSEDEIEDEIVPAGPERPGSLFWRPAVTRLVTYRTLMNEKKADLKRHKQSRSQFEDERDRSLFIKEFFQIVVGNLAGGHRHE